jgi:FkbM family methyltransferase
MATTSATSGGSGPDPFGRFAPDRRLRRLIGLARTAPDGWLGRRFAFAIRRLALARLAEPVDVEALGARFRLYPGDNVCEKRILFTPQYFDPRERAILARHIDAAPAGFVFLDVGANIGGYALFVAARAGPKATILAVEPQPAILARLRDNAALNPALPVRIIACAASERDGPVTLFLDRDNRGEASLAEAPAGRRADGAVTVEAKTLATIAAEAGLGRIDALKIDVEGFEDRVLGPFLQTAPAHLRPRLLILEDGRSRWAADLPGQLAAAGYSLVATTRLNLVWEQGRGN